LPARLRGTGVSGFDGDESVRAVSNLFFGVVIGAFGVGYIIYGKKQTKLAPVIAGVLLCVYTYFVESWLWLCVVGALLLAAPFFIDF
jgi:hypothetical protein